MPGPISHLTPKQRRELFGDLNYLNLAELRGFCRAHSIPFAIWIETEAGKRKKSKDTDRKSVVLERVRTYLESGRVPPATCFPAHVVDLDGPPDDPKPDDRLCYGWYDKHHAGLIGLLRQLTGGAYRNGAVARILMREFWTAGEAPTLREFAEAWLVAEERGLGVERGEHPEAAWLTDRARKEAGSDWKAKRERIAARALGILRQLPEPDRA